MHDALPPPRWIARGVVLLVILSLFAVTAVIAVDGGYDPDTLSAGTIEGEANGSTVVGIQGFHYRGQGSIKKPARLVSIAPDGETEWLYNGTRNVDARWFYDVDPLPNGNLLVTSTNPDGTVVFELDPDTRERVWTEEFDIHDTHDVAWMGDDRIVVANMRQWNESCECSDDRVFVYDLEEDEISWEWMFRDHYPNSTDGGFNDDWTHVNDVDVLSDDRLLLSPRNFDQAIVVDMETGEITERLGSDGNHEVLNEQHNPDYFLDDEGNPTMLVADSENDRIVEYTKLDGEWELTWELGSAATLSWPRDADRLPNGNTLVVDTLNHRIIEVTPRGDVVWEVYATWGPYDAERTAHGQGSNGPAMRDLGVTGSYDVGELSDGAGAGDGGQAFSTWLVLATEDTVVQDPVFEFAQLWSHVTPWIRPVWLDSWGFATLVGGLVVLVGWGLAEAVHQRRRLLGALRSGGGRLVGSR